MGGERAVVRLDEVGAAGGREHPDPDLRLVRPEVQDQVVQLPRERERPERDAERVERCEVGGRRRLRPPHADLGQAAVAVDPARDRAVADRVRLERPLERREREAAGAGRPVGAGRQLARPPAHGLLEARAWHDLVHEPPLDRALALDALLGRAEEVGAVTAHPALVDEPREPAGAREDGEQRYLGERHRGVAVVGHDDPVGRQRQLVAAARAGAVDAREVDLPRLGRRLLDRVARLVGEFAEVHLPAVRRLREHADVGARAEDPLLARGHDDRADLGVLEPEPLHRVVELDVDAEVVGVELQLVPGHEPAVLPHVQREPGHRAVEGQAPVLVARRLGPKVHQRARAPVRHALSPG